jgi:hypothetical protein
MPWLPSARLELEKALATQESNRDTTQKRGWGEKPPNLWLIDSSPDGYVIRLTNTVLLVMGLYRARQVDASVMVRQWSSRAKQPGLTRRLSHFLANSAVHVREWYEPIARQWLKAYAGQEVHGIVDGSKVGL